MIAIRDDDISYWTRPEELESLYQAFWGRGFSISLAVIPCAVKSFYPEDRDQFYQAQTLKPIYENAELVRFLREKLYQKRISIMLHGYSHQYKVNLNKKSQPILATNENLIPIRENCSAVKLNWVGEYAWKNYEDLKRDTSRGKQLLEDTFHTKVRVFVPPSNQISYDGVRAVAECGFDISATMRLTEFNRKKDLSGYKNWIIKLLWRLRYNKVFPYVMAYGDHKELHSYTFVPQTDFEKLRQVYRFCKIKKAPFVLATHYWEVEKMPEFKRNLMQFIDEISEEGVVDLAELFRN